MKTSLKTCLKAGLIALAGVWAAPAIAQTPPQTPAQTYLSHAAALYDEQPDITRCRPGRLSQAAKTEALETLNAIRALHGLQPVTYDPQSDDAVMQAALMMAANGQLSHHPPPSWACYTEAGAAAAGMSNIRGGVVSPYLGFDSPADDIAGWLNDVHNAMAGVGHRRWLLDPFLTTVSFGKVAAAYDATQVSGGAVLKITDGKPILMGGADNTPPHLPPQIIAYPYHDYPQRFYADGALLSLSLLTDPEHLYRNMADFSHATVTIRERGGPALPVSGVHADNDLYGLPNDLYFSAGALKRGIVYDVTVERIAIPGAPAGAATRVDYWFRLIP